MENGGLSGIYLITNNYNNYKYVGQSKNVFNRKKQHFSALAAGKHPNKLMQRDWKKYKTFFSWSVIEFCDIKDLNEREEYWIKKLNTIENGYNQGWVPYKRKSGEKIPSKYHASRYKKRILKKRA